MNISYSSDRTDPHPPIHPSPPSRTARSLSPQRWRSRRLQPGMPLSESCHITSFPVFQRKVCRKPVVNPGLKKKIHRTYSKSCFPADFPLNQTIFWGTSCGSKKQLWIKAWEAVAGNWMQLYQENGVYGTMIISIIVIHIFYQY